MDTKRTDLNRTAEEKAKEVLNSNISDYLKIELIGLLMNPTKVEYTPVNPVIVKWPGCEGYKITCKPTTGEAPVEWPGLSGYDDTDWCKQHLKDVEANNVLNNPVSYKNS